MADQNENTELAVVAENTLTEALNDAKKFYPEMVERSGKAVLALSGIKEIRDDADFERVTAILVKVSKTYTLVKGLRETVTKQTDGIKDLMMAPEKTISLEASHKASEAWRVKNLLNGYAQAKAQRIAKEQEDIRKNQQRSTEILRLKTHFENHFYESVVNRVTTLTNDIAAYFNNLKLDDWEAKTKRFHINPKLKAEDFESWFIVDYDKSLLSTEEFADLMLKVKAQFTYDAINEIYVGQASKVVNEYKDKLPAKKKELEELKALEASNAAEFAKKQKEIDDRLIAEQKEREENAKKAIEENRAKTQLESDTKSLDNEFNAQIAQQSIEEQKNVRKTKVATISCEPAKIVTVLSKVMFEVFKNPSFKGYIKTDKEGKPLPPDEFGRPIYVDFVEDILSFYAKNCDVAIDGITIGERVTAINKVSK